MMYIHYACVCMHMHFARIRISVDHAPADEAHRDEAMASFRRQCWPLVDLYLDIFFLVAAKLQCQDAPKMMYIHYACVCMHMHFARIRISVDHAPADEAHRDEAMASFRRQCWPLVDLYLDM